MSKDLDKRYKEILEQEKIFLKRVVYYIHAYTPRPWWHVLIPFKFLLEYFSRKKDQRSFEDFYLHLKQIALAMAYQEIQTNSPESKDSELLAQLRDFCTHSSQIRCRGVHQLLEQWLGLLKKHYTRLLQVQEKYYHLLIGKAYGSAGNYQAFLRELSEIEKEMDQVWVDFQNNKARALTCAGNRQMAFAEIRKRELREAFGADQS